MYIVEWIVWPNKRKLFFFSRQKNREYFPLSGGNNILLIDFTVSKNPQKTTTIHPTLESYLSFRSSKPERKGEREREREIKWENMWEYWSYNTKRIEQNENMILLCKTVSVCQVFRCCCCWIHLLSNFLFLQRDQNVNI